MNVRGERILVFGDSLSHHGADDAPEIWDVNIGSARTSSAPGDLLASMLLEAGAAAVRIDANVGRSAKNFWTAPNRRQTRPASALITADQLFRPSKVIVMLGTNDADAGGMDLASIIKIRDTYRAMGAEVIAIGPPVFASPAMTMNAAKVYTTLGQVFPTVIDARPLSTTTGRAGDGVHFQPSAAKAFAQQLMAKVIEPPTLVASAKSALPGVAITFVGVLALGLLAVWLSRRELGKSTFGASHETQLTGLRVRKTSMAAVSYGDKGREHRDSATYGVFDDAGVLVATIENVGRSGYKDVANWQMLTVGGRPRRIWPVGFRTLKQLREWLSTHEQYVINEVSSS